MQILNSSRQRKSNDNLHIFGVQQNGGTIVDSLGGVTGKLKMAAIYRKYICNVLYLSWYMRQQPDSDGYAHIFGVQQHAVSTVTTLRHQVGV